MLKVAADHGFHFDAAQMPLNVMDAHFRSFAHLVVPELVQQEIGVLGMKSMGDGVILKSKTVSPTECLHYAHEPSHFGSDYRNRPADNSGSGNRSGKNIQPHES